MKRSIGIYNLHLQAMGGGEKLTLTLAAVEMVALSTNQFRERWLNMPRAKASSAAVRRKTWRQFSRNMASHLGCEAARSLSYRQLRRANRCLFAALRFHAPGLVGCMLRELSHRGKEAHELAQNLAD